MMPTDHTTHAYVDDNGYHWPSQKCEKCRHDHDLQEQIFLDEEMHGVLPASDYLGLPAESYIVDDDDTIMVLCADHARQQDFVEVAALSVRPDGYYWQSEACADCASEAFDYERCTDEENPGRILPPFVGYLDGPTKEYRTPGSPDGSDVTRLCFEHAAQRGLDDGDTTAASPDDAEPPRCRDCVAEGADPGGAPSWRYDDAEGKSVYLCADHTPSLDDLDCHYCADHRESGGQGTGDTDIRHYLDGGVCESLCRTHALAAFGDEDCADTAHRAAAICQS